MGRTRSTTARHHGGVRHWSFSAALIVALAGPLAASPAHAGPREQLRGAYDKALAQYNNLELDASMALLDEAIASGRAANPDDPALAPLLVLRAGVIFSNTGKADLTKEALAAAVKVDYNVQIPPDLRSPQLQALLDEARKAAGSPPSEAIRHETPAPVCGGEIVFEALASKLPDGGQAAFYWRRKGSTEEPVSLSMDTFGNLATAVLPASDHADASIEYFIYIFDGANNPLANKGDLESPITLEISCKVEEEAPPPPPPEEPKPSLPRFFFNLGIGTGLGIASGTADLSYQQYSPRARDGSQQFVYGVREYACSVARWRYPQDELADAQTFFNDMTALQANPNTLPPGLSFSAYSPEELAANYDQSFCSQHHGIATGFASAPLHIAPEFGFRATKALVISVQARLQVVTGSKVFRDDPKALLEPSFINNVYDVNRTSPAGVQVKPPFSFMVMVKAKYFLGKEGSKFRPFVGGLLGAGSGARLRVNMGFANDRNGNSIPDDREFAYDLLNEDAPFDGATNPCTPVWPYNNGCTPGPGDDPNNLGDLDRAQAGFKATSADTSARIDTVRVGPIMIGATGGFHYQLAKNFGLFGEVQVGGWFAKRSSLLLDFNVGPMITF